MNITGLNLNALKKTYKRLKKDTKNFTSLIIRDAVDHVDFNNTLDTNLNYLIEKINNDSYFPTKPLLHLTPKSKGINRPTVVLNIYDALVYRYCIEQIEDDLLFKTKQKNIRGGIKITSRRSSFSGHQFYEKWFDDWMQHNSNLEKSLKWRDYMVCTDIASYFENINIQLLRDQIRSEITGKEYLLNLLFYFLENTIVRYNYEINTHTGLLQEDIDCARVLAYYFLRPLDEVMEKFCMKNSVEYFRYVDDMCVLVDSEITGRKALKSITESLRNLRLVASIEKTSIITSKQSTLELFFNENKKLTKLEEELIEKIKLKVSIKSIERKLIILYNNLLKQKKDKYKNWQKVLKRFYQICGYGKFNIFGTEIKNHVINYPIIFSDIRIKKFVLSQKNKELNKIIKTLVKYLYSDENLYPQLESNLIDVILSIPNIKISKGNILLLKKLAIEILESPKIYKCQSDYVKGLAALLIFKFNDSVDIVAKLYLSTKFNNSILRKYLIVVSLTSNNVHDCKNVLNKSRMDPDSNIQNLINMLDDAKKASKSANIKRYIAIDNLMILFKPKLKFEIKENFDNVRANVLEIVLSKYS